MKGVSTMATKWYGNINNRLEEGRMVCEEIKAGTGMTEYSWSDRHAYEVTQVIDQKHVIVREYDHKHVGEAFTNDWELVSNPDNPERLITKRGDNWYWTTTLTKAEFDAMDDIPRVYAIINGFDPEVIARRGKQSKYRKASVSFGKADYYYDYEF